jgi:hypothetical protein
MVGFAVSKKVAANVQLIQTSTLNIKHKTQMVRMPKLALQAIFFYWTKSNLRLISTLKYKHPETKVIGDTKRHSDQQETQYLV